MKYNEYTEKLEAIKNIIEHKHCATAQELAEKFGVSVRTIHRMLQQLRQNGLQVKFNRKRSCYEFKKN